MQTKFIIYIQKFWGRLWKPHIPALIVQTIAPSLTNGTPKRNRLGRWMVCCVRRALRRWYLCCCLVSKAGQITVKQKKERFGVKSGPLFWCIWLWRINKSPSLELLKAEAEGSLYKGAQHAVLRHVCPWQFDSVLLKESPATGNFIISRASGYGVEPREEC